MPESTARLANGTLIKISAGSPSNYLTIGNAKGFTIMTGSNSEIETTHLGSAAKEFIIGFPDNGTVSFDVDTDFGDVGQAAALAAKEANPPTRCDFQLVLPGGTTPTISFEGYVKKFDVQGSVDGTVKSSLEIRVTGAVARA